MKMRNGSNRTVRTENFNAVKQIVESQLQARESVIDLGARDVVEDMSIFFIEMRFCVQYDIHIFCVCVCAREHMCVCVWEKKNKMGSQNTINNILYM